MLIGSWNQGRVEAADAARGPDYVCPDCRGPLILKKGRIVLHHFSHKSPTNCPWAAAETRAHLVAKTALRDGFAARGLKVEIEVDVLSEGGDGRADVLITSSNGKDRAAIEVQDQSIEFDAISRRTRA